MASNGYVLVRVGKDHHLADCRGYAYEHRLVAEARIGRKLEPGEQVHHINGNKQDNRPENIEVMPTLAHHKVRHRKAGAKLRIPGEGNPFIECNCGCGDKLEKYDASGRPRLFITGHNPHDLATQSKFMEAAADGTRIREIAARTGQSLQAAKCMASKLVAQKKIIRISRGFYGRKN